MFKFVKNRPFRHLIKELPHQNQEFITLKDVDVNIIKTYYSIENVNKSKCFKKNY